MFYEEVPVWTTDAEGNEVPYTGTENLFGVKCDDCGEHYYDDDTGGSLFYDADEAINTAAEDKGWMTVHGNHYCEDCAPKHRFCRDCFNYEKCLKNPPQSDDTDLDFEEIKPTKCYEYDQNPDSEAALEKTEGDAK